MSIPSTALEEDDTISCDATATIRAPIRATYLCCCREIADTRNGRIFADVDEKRNAIHPQLVDEVNSYAEMVEWITRSDRLEQQES